MRVSDTLCVVLLTVTLAGGLVPVAAQERKPRVPVPVLGRTLDMRVGVDERRSGELIEVDDDALLLLGEEGLLTVSLSDITSVSYHRHGFGTNDALLWVGLGALVTGLGMTAACTQVEGTSCSGVFLGFSISWAVVGGLLAGSVASGQPQEVSPTPSGLRPYARFPQGAPAGFEDSVATPRGGGRQ